MFFKCKPLFFLCLLAVITQGPFEFPALRYIIIWATWGPLYALFLRAAYISELRGTSLGTSI